MDIPKRLIAINMFGAVVFALYFFLQTCEAIVLQALSFIVTIPLAKNVLDRMSHQVRIEDARNYPSKKLFINFLRHDWGIWTVLSIETMRRIAYYGVSNGVLSMSLMFVSLLEYDFSASTGVCYTNLKIFRKGTIGFAVVSWLTISIVLLVGSGWVVGNSFSGTKN